MSAPKPNTEATEAQLAAARLHLAANPETARLLDKAGVSLADFARHGVNARDALAERHAAERKR